ncbi:glycosyltransferase family 4 protein [uncultured Cellulomonas sp.]|uniref:glycosyltransferase family 4 protein n=1 Tax=uncultured Cellulomonas sp. TaxID=189682 RepID=UPI00263222A5|nr:glycosyltransferase family 4 protein [uncultured Cellulomonas sp.]
MTDARTRRRRVVIAHPSPDLYGSDRQLLETVEALRDHGWQALVQLPEAGPLVPELQARGALVRIAAFPVLRKSLLRPVSLLALPWRMAASTLALVGVLRRSRGALVYVNTVTIPQWLLAARLARMPVLCHVHEAEQDQAIVVRRLMAAPLLLAQRVIANSGAARRAVVDVVPALDGTVTVVHNGVPGPPAAASPPARHQAAQPATIALVARLSPRKGIDVALEATALLAAQGRDVRLVVCGTVFPGYEWYEEQLRERSARADLAGRVTLAGYVHPTWPVLAEADVVIVPSRAEPFGNTAVEGLLSRRPVVASDVQGLAEVVVDGRTGVLVPPDDPPALAWAIAALLDDPAAAARLAQAGHDDAVERFGVARYGAAVAGIAATVAGRG